METPPTKPVPKPRPRTSFVAQSLSSNNVLKQLPETNQTTVKLMVIKMEEELLKFNASFNSTRTEAVDVVKQVRRLKETLGKPQVDILLIGKTGVGKSALGNSILRRNTFESCSSLSSVTESVTFDVSEFNDLQIKVVDTPGVVVTEKSIEQAKQEILSAMSEAISINPQGYHAFLLVLKYGDRLTNEDKETIQFLKKIFGVHFFKKYCIIVMTCGDKFYEDNDIPFESWVAKQTRSVFTELLKECDERIVVFDNKTKEESKKIAQLTALLHLIDSLKIENCRYSTEHFDSAQFSRDTLYVETEKDLIESEAVKETNLIYQRFQLLLENCQSEKVTILLADLQERAQTLYDKVKKQDKSTCVLQQALDIISSLISSISDEIKYCKKIAEEREKAFHVIQEKNTEYAKNLQKQRDEFEKRYEEGKIKDEKLAEMLQDHLTKMTEQQEKCQKEIKEFEDRHINQRNSRRELHDLTFNIKQLRETFAQGMKKKKKKGIFARMFHLSSK